MAAKSALEGLGVAKMELARAGSIPRRGAQDHSLTSLTPRLTLTST